ncbi:hypothetical protein FDECE_5314 [Fusarium decemcellulare]|nr:hypothetical protein FDECE_5314 [Fusarium decemcellulare]
MDPFSSLPSELRLEILRLIRSERRILSLAQASPIMLKQYITSKAFLTRSWLTSDLDGDMIQDAMTIITRPPLDVSGFQHLAHHHYCLWTGQQFTNPIDNGDHRLIEKLGKLCRRLIHFIEDYVTKATSPFPPRAYLSLPCSSAIRATSNFKGQIVDQRFDAADLSDEERGRLLKAFLRFEAICKTYPAVISAHTDMVMGRNENSPWEEIIRSFADDPFYSFGQHGLRLWEKEAVSCVYAYLQSLYGAMFAQCGNSWLPCPSHSRGLLYPDNFFMDADLYASDLGLGPSATEPMSHRLPNLIPCSLAAFGFDLAAGLLRFATDGDEQRCRLKRWFEDFCEARTQVNDSLHVCGFPGYSPLRQQKCCGDGPGTYEMLHHRIQYDTVSQTSRLHLRIYRQRAWVFFDDARLFSSSPFTFPTKNDLSKELEQTSLDMEWISDPRGARSLRRSQKTPGCATCSICRPVEEADQEKYEEHGRGRYQLPCLKDNASFSRLLRFWE